MSLTSNTAKILTSFQRAGKGSDESYKGYLHLGDAGEKHLRRKLLAPERQRAAKLDAFNCMVECSCWKWTGQGAVILDP